MRSNNFSYEINSGCLPNLDEDRDATIVGYTFGALAALVSMAPTTAEKLNKIREEREKSAHNQ
jgi:hypothetical protein